VPDIAEAEVVLKFNVCFWNKPDTELFIVIEAWLISSGLFMLKIWFAEVAITMIVDIEPVVAHDP
jgi:uncharacterized protein YciU (UPF0263 family)